MNLTEVLKYYEDECTAVYELLAEENRYLRNFGRLSKNYVARKRKVRQQIDSYADIFGEIRDAGVQEHHRESIRRMGLTLGNILLLDKENERLGRVVNSAKNRRERSRVSSFSRNPRHRREHAAVECASNALHCA